MEPISTRVIAVDPLQPSLKTLEEAASILRDSGLVAIPTETVYGLAANALDAKAVRRIYEAKGRPSNNPLIVHVSSISQAREFVSNWPAMAQKLAEVFWPGPLTMVLEHNGTLPKAVTTGGDSVALRLPAHPVARSLIQVANLPLAAPSANASGCISPTCATHVVKDLQGKVEMILDAGNCEVGIESTVVDVRTEQVKVLRPGIISSRMLEDVLGCKVLQDGQAGSGAMPSPGMLEKHYAPRTVAIWVEENPASILQGMKDKGLAVGMLALDKTPGAICLGTDPTTYAKNLYGALHTLDDMGLDRILVMAPPDTSEWAAVRDRLKRATVRL